MVNPANPTYQSVGVFSLKLARLYQFIYQQTNKKYCIIHGTDGYDEVSLTSVTKLYSNEEERLACPEWFGLPQYSQEDIFGGDTIAEAAKIFMAILENYGTKAQADVVCANAALGIRCFDQSRSITWTLQSATCDNSATTPVETVNPSGITLADGDAWVCTFTNVYTPPPTNVYNVQDSSALWTDIIGKGMGNPKKHKAQVKLTIPNYAQVDSLYGQMVANNTGAANYVRFILPGKNNYVQVDAITSPADHNAGNFWYGEYIDPAKLPTKTVAGRWSLQKTGTKNHIPRALVLYPTYRSTTNTWVNMWNTYDAAEAEVYWDTALGWTPSRR